MLARRAPYNAKSGCLKFPRVKHLSMTRRWAREPLVHFLAAELISLCQTVTDDGHLADEEVLALRQWVDDNGSEDLPARDFLLQTVRRITEDGKVTDEERGELYQAIEEESFRSIFESPSAASGRQSRTPLTRRNAESGMPKFSSNVMFGSADALSDLGTSWLRVAATRAGRKQYATMRSPGTARIL